MGERSPRASQKLVWVFVWAAAASGLIYLLISTGAESKETATPSERAAAFDQAWAWSEVRASGWIPLWNPYRMAGLPLIPASTFSPYYPPSWIFSLGSERSWPYYALWWFHGLLAAAIMSFVCRRLGFSLIAAGIAGLAWMLVGPVGAGFGAHDLPKLEALCFLPLAAYGAICLGAGDFRRAMKSTSAAFSLQLLTGAYSILLVTFYLWLGVTLVANAVPAFTPAIRRRSDDAVFDDEGEPAAPPGFQRGRIARAAGVGLITIAVALAISAVAWIPAVEWNRLSNMRDGVGTEASRSGEIGGAAALTWLWPSGDSLGGGQFYLGAGVLCFAAFGCFARGRWRSAACLSVVLAAFFWAFAGGGFFPSLHEILYRFLPGFRMMVEPSDFLSAFAFLIVLAAAAGVEAYFISPPRLSATEASAQASSPAEPPEARRLRARGSIWLTLAITAAVWMLMSKMSLSAIEAKFVNAALEMDIAARSDSARLQSRMHLAEGLLPVLGFAGAWAFAQSMSSTLKAKRWITGGLLAAMTLFIALDLGRNAARGFIPPPIPRIVDGGDSLASTGAGRELRPNWGERKNSDELYELRRVGGRLEGRRVAGDYDLGALTGYEQIYNLSPDLQPNFLRLFAVDRLAVPNKDVETLQQTGEYVVEATGDRETLFSRKHHVYIRQVRHKEFVETREEILNKIADPKFNVLESTTGLVSDLPREARAQGLRSFTDHDVSLSAVIQELLPGRIRFETESKLPSLVQVSEPALPGWEVTIDSKPLLGGIVEDDGYFIAFKLPSGEHTVSLEYDPASQRLGTYMTLLALGFLAWRVGWRRGRGEDPRGKDAQTELGGPPAVASKQKARVWEI